MKRFLSRSDLPVWLLVPAGLILSSASGDIVSTFYMIIAIAVMLGLCGIVLFFRAGEHQTRHVVVYTLSIVLFVVVSLTEIPLRLSFVLSRSALRELALSVEEGESVSIPVWAGAYRIKEVGRKPDGSVYLWTNPNPAGSDGFVFRYTGSGYNLWSELKLDDDWYFICED